MPISATTGPNITFGVTLSSSGQPNEYNEERGPSLNDLGEGTLDPRPQFTYRPGNRPGVPVYGWPGSFGGPVIDQTPVTLLGSAIAASQSATTGATWTPGSGLSSASVSSAGITLTTITPLSGGSPVPVLAIDSTFGGVAFGTAGTINFWDPTRAISRCLAIYNSSATSTTSNATITINGFDLYGSSMSVAVNGPASGATVTTLKAFKYVSNVQFSSALNSTALKIGTADVFGFPLFGNHPAYITAWWGASSAAQLVTISGSNAVHTFGSTATPTTATGDVRGTIATSAFGGNSNSTTSNNAAGANRLVLFMSPTVANLATISSTNFAGLVGQPQV